jgi:hypothetical protein
MPADIGWLLPAFWEQPGAASAAGQPQPPALPPSKALMRMLQVRLRLADTALVCMCPCESVGHGGCCRAAALSPAQPGRGSFSLSHRIATACGCACLARCRCPAGQRSSGTLLPARCVCDGCVTRARCAGCRTTTSSSQRDTRVACVTLSPCLHLTHRLITLTTGPS